MKKIALLVTILATLFSGNTFAQSLVASDVNFPNDVNEEKVVFSLEGFSTPIPAIAQFVVSLPDGFSLKEGRRGFEYDVKGPEDTGIAMDHSVTIFQRENGDYYVLLSDNSGYEFYEANGYLISLTVKKESSVADGSYTANLKEIVIDDVTGKVHLVSSTEGSFNITVGDVAEDVYTVAGAFKVGNEEQPSFFGQMWAPELTTNDMVKGEDGIYTLSFSNVALEAGTILYKVVKNHSWDVNWGFNGDNADYIVNEAKTYDVTFKFNPDELLSNGFNLTCELVDVTIVGVRDIRADSEDGKLYNTAGQRVVKAGKGLYIQNGKKVVKK